MSQFSVPPWQRMASLLFGFIFSCRIMAAAQSPLSPVVNADGSASFALLAPHADAVQLVIKGAKPVSMNRGDGGLWTLTGAPMAPDIYAYWFVIDGVSFPDPANPIHQPNLMGSLSEFTIPGPRPLPWELADVPHGEIHHHFYRSAVIGVPLDYLVYTPPGYDARGSIFYPVLYLLHGYSDDSSAWTSLGRANVILDNAISQGTAKPMIVVMPLGYGAPEIVTRTGPGYGDARLRERNLIGFKHVLLEEIIPKIEGEYRIKADRGSRAIAGLSMGGAQSLFIGINEVNSFAWIGSFSAGGMPEDLDKLFGGADKSINPGLRLLWISCAKDDELLAPNHHLMDWLKARGIRFTPLETPGGHTWGVWRRNFANFVTVVFRETPPL